MTATPGFTVEIDQNPYLPEGATRVDAIVSVTASGSGAATEAGALEIIIIDCSSSMDGDKIESARQATAAAIAELRDGVSFALIAGTHVSRQVYPAARTAIANAVTKAEATTIVGKLRADGGTAIGTWLHQAGSIAALHPDAIRHAILLTDGKNGEEPADFRAAIDGSVGAFTCDCRGVGTDWQVDELRSISSALLGTVDIVADAADLATDFRTIMGAAMGKGVGDIALRLWTPKTARVRFVKQVAPTVEDLTGRRTESGPLTGDYPLGAWGDETREYHLSVEVAPQAVGRELLAARASLVRSDDVLGQGLVKAIWTDDMALSTMMSPGVAHYTGQAELAEAIQEGLAARKAGDDATATARLGRAVALAAASGNDDSAKLLERVVDVLDAPTGTVRLRAHVEQVDEMTLDTRSTKSVRRRR
jgi:von Willebrand factor type A C-terminal domain/von Willebrand factor type A domain